MITEFEMDGFRKFKSIKLKDLSQINILLGNNNAGKSTVLEGIYAFTCGKNVFQVIGQSVLRNRDTIGLYEFMDNIMSAFNEKESLPWQAKFTASMSDGKSEGFLHTFHPDQIFADLEPTLMKSFGALKRPSSEDLQLIGNWGIEDSGGNYEEPDIEITFPLTNKWKSVHSQNFLQSRIVSAFNHRYQEDNYLIYSFLKREKRGKLIQDFVAEMSRTFEQVTGIDCVPYPDGELGPISLMTRDHGLIPIYNFGEGVQRWYNILGGMIVLQNSIHCIEEVDAMFHPDAQRDLALNLVHYAEKYKNQLFLTSHSLEFVDILLDAIYGEDATPPAEDKIRIITMRNDPATGAVKIRNLTGLDAYQSREKYRLELR